ncbi:hypothetical protein IV500_20920 [Paeniglutamicibacter antarcticus]|uniref:Pentapeptide repeat-containing protein n=1 Tax=Arthrobacter terrae TaxID=2935737 RepID=A0A931CVQ6_9MICC|nr:hypothetical protein [Arthrobacter terrae]MBG0741819.1 hypothetical protein [Arthrobacter terrae]
MDNSGGPPTGAVKVSGLRRFKNWWSSNLWPRVKRGWTWLTPWRQRSSRVVGRAKLSTAVLGAVIAAVLVAFAAYQVLHRFLPVGDQAIQPKDLTQFALTIVAGIGGVVALVVAYRRQLGIEQSRFVERFGAAANQLGSADVAVRLAGVYAMAGVADEARSIHERQQCVDVLCAYLRLPYSPELGANHETERQHKMPGREGEENTHHFLYRQNDKEVRQTIVRVITAHLQKDAKESWSPCSFDFTGAILESVDFNGARFRGEATYFRGVTFSGALARFNGVVFDGEWTLFSDAKFSSGSSFKNAILRSGFTSFENAKFSSGSSFDGATFSSGFSSFNSAVFSGGWTTFSLTVFSRARASFHGTEFGADRTSFYRTTFGGGFISFISTDFGAGVVSFEEPKFWNPSPIFDWDDDVPDDERKPKPANVLPTDWPPKVDSI